MLKHQGIDPTEGDIPPALFSDYARFIREALQYLTARSPSGFPHWSTILIITKNSHLFHQPDVKIQILKFSAVVIPDLKSEPQGGLREFME